METVPREITLEHPPIHWGARHSHEIVITEALTILKDRPGAIAEFGVYNGEMTRKLANHGRNVYAFDTFEGMPKSTYTEDLDSDNPPGKFKSLPTTEQELSKYPNIYIIKGLFSDTLPTISEDLKFILAYIDCDHYLSHKQVLDWLPKHLVPSAVLIFDDYKICPGATKAIDEFIGVYKLLGSKIELLFDKIIIWP